MKRPPRKIVDQALLFLLLGAIVNLTVGVSRSMNPPPLLLGPRLSASEALLLWSSSHPHMHTSGQVEGWRHENWGISTTRVSPGLTFLDVPSGSFGFAATNSTLILRITESGWPCHWMRNSDEDAGFGPVLSDSRTVLARTWDRLLTCDVQGPGFAINTLFYAAILWLLFALPGALRRWWRLKRGLCPACAYPIGASDLCTECGMPVNPRKVETTPL